MKRFRYLCVCVALWTAVAPTAAFAQGFSRDEAELRFVTADGLKAKVFASEPEVRQAIFVKCDDRGRLWTIQYLQYPNPAGLERVKVDRWSRTIYDRIPEPPPRGPRGADRITIMSDTDGDGRADEFKDFLDGMNIITGVEFGHGGVYVLQCPYLLFYADRDRNDVPDADPEVLLTGFGMEDAQAMSNHLTWGPDGWLYGVNGSTTTCRIRGLEFQQGLWRYHPLTKEFELFCEGGSNCFGVTFDDHGELYYSTNGGPFVHAVQGGYFFKSFGKHGPLHNLFAYHFFPNLECDQVPGGPPTGGTIYSADALPAEYRGRFLAGNFLGHTASSWNIVPHGSTVKATFGGVFFDANDTWGGPTDFCIGPDGCAYLSDFYDQRTAHPDPDANWDRSNGRIYRIEPSGGAATVVCDIGGLSSNELVDLLSHSNRWYADRARVELANRRDKSVVPRLKEMALQTDDETLALQGLWALHVTAGIDEALSANLLDHPFHYTRFWATRLIGDAKQASAKVAQALVELAERESHPVVLAQLAATAKRLPGRQGLPVVAALLDRQAGSNDPRVPWLIWWAIEAKALTDQDALTAMFAESAAWENAMKRDNALRLLRRYAADGTSDGYQAGYDLLRMVPESHQLAALDAVRIGLAERSLGLEEIGQGGLFEQHADSDDTASAPRSKRGYDPLAGALRNELIKQWREQPDQLAYMELALHAQESEAYEHLKHRLSAGDAAEQSALLPLVEKFGQPDVVPLLLERFEPRQSAEVLGELLDALARFDAPEITERLLLTYPRMDLPIQGQIRAVLFARPAGALAFLARVEAGEIDSKSAPVEQLRRLASHGDSKIDDLVRKHWGNIGPGSSEEKLATMRRFSNDLRAAPGDPARGKPLYAKHCGTCHQLHGEGEKLGPDLTTANRQDQAALLASIVDPSAVIRLEYTNYVALTDSGRVATGLIAEQDGSTVTILTAENKRVKLHRDEIEELIEADVSLMPERILDNLTPQELRDIFSYMQRVQP